MEIHDKLRRCLVMCSRFARNLAYYRAGLSKDDLRRKDHFWRTTNGNFVDVCVLEWCKMFANYSDKCHWKKILDAPDDFLREIEEHLEINSKDFDDYLNSFKFFRDKYIAHLDDVDEWPVPEFDMALEIAIFYYEKVKKAYKNQSLQMDYPLDLQAFYKDCLNQAKLKYAGF